MAGFEEYDIDVIDLEIGDTIFPKVQCISISRKDRQPFHDWKTKQAIKEHFSKGKTAIEVYPPQSNVVDNDNVYHLWVLPFHLPFGLHNMEHIENYKIIQ